MSFLAPEADQNGRRGLGWRASSTLHGQERGVEVEWPSGVSSSEDVPGGVIEWGADV